MKNNIKINIILSLIFGRLLILYDCTEGLTERTDFGPKKKGG
jgi:hypothetical protein